jgi:hypothetical protein
MVAMTKDPAGRLLRKRAAKANKRKVLLAERRRAALRGDMGAGPAMVTCSITAEKLQALRADPEMEDWAGEVELLETALATGGEVTLPETLARDMGLIE